MPRPGRFGSGRDLLQAECKVEGSMHSFARCPAPSGKELRSAFSGQMRKNIPGPSGWSREAVDAIDAVDRRDTTHPESKHRRNRPADWLVPVEQGPEAARPT